MYDSNTHRRLIAFLKNKIIVIIIILTKLISESVKMENGWFVKFACMINFIYLISNWDIHSELM